MSSYPSGWGENGHARAVTKDYREGYDRIFGNTSEAEHEKESLQLKAVVTKRECKHSLHTDALQRIKDGWLV